MPVKPFLENKTTKAVLAQEGVVARTLWRKAFGAMLFGLPGSFVFVFAREQRVAITNVFVFEELDIVWLDKRMRVVALTERFRPFALHTINRVPAQYVLELPGGTVARTKTRTGNIIHCREAL